MSDESKAAEKAAADPAQEQVSAPKPVEEPDTSWADEAVAAVEAAEASGAAKAAGAAKTSGAAKAAGAAGAAKTSEAVGAAKAAGAGGPVGAVEAGEGSGADKAVEAVEEKPAERVVADDDVVEPEFSITGSLPEPRTKILAILAGGVLALDVLTKVLAVAFLEGADPIKLFGGVLYLTFVRNPGAAFGMAEGMTWILALIALGVAGFILWISRNLRSQPWAIGLGLVLGGAVGNLADRLFRQPGPMRGHVVDFLSLFDPFGRVWPVFNVADMAIVCGGVTIVVLALMQHDYDGTVHKEEKKVEA